LSYRGVPQEARQSDRQFDRQSFLAVLEGRRGGALASTVVNQDTEDTAQDEGDGQPGAAA